MLNNLITWHVYVILLLAGVLLLCVQHAYRQRGRSGEFGSLVLWTPLAISQSTNQKKGLSKIVVSSKFLASFENLAKRTTAYSTLGESCPLPTWSLRSWMFSMWSGLSHHSLSSKYKFWNVLKKLRHFWGLQDSVFLSQNCENEEGLARHALTHKVFGIHWTNSATWSWTRTLTASSRRRTYVAAVGRSSTRRSCSASTRRSVFNVDLTGDVLVFLFVFFVSICTCISTRRGVLKADLTGDVLVFVFEFLFVLVLVFPREGVCWRQTS